MVTVEIFRGVAQLKKVGLFYLDTKTEGPAILCLHGLWGRAETWADLIQHYGTNYRVIAPDQRGHGLSGKPFGKYTAEELAEDMVALLDFLEIESAILVGHSMGGRVAGYLAALYPQYVKALAILDKSAAAPTRLETLRWDQKTAEDPLTKNWPLPFPTLQAAMAFIRQATDSDLSYQYFMNSLVETVAGYQLQFSPHAIAANIAHNEDWFQLLPKITCPVLLIRSQSHQAVPDEDWRTMQTLLPNCLAHEVSHPDHNVHLSNKQEFYSYIDQFLKQVIHFEGTGLCPGEG